VNLPVRVFGMDAEGRPFSQKAEARNISLHGARVAGLEKQLKPGDVVGVQSGDKKARCKVIWVVDAGPAKKIEAGVKMVEGQPCPWQSEMESPGTPATARNATPATLASATGASATAPAVTSASEDKRKFPRRRVPLSIEIRDEQGGAPMKTRTADANGRGCYVETMLPLPVGKALIIIFWLDTEQISTPATVRTCDGGVGMGIEFTGLDPAMQMRLQQQVDEMAAGSEPSTGPAGAS
jgi:PilZ domain